MHSVPAMIAGEVVMYAVGVTWLALSLHVGMSKAISLGLTPFLCKILYDVTGQTPAIPIGERFQSAPLYMSWVMVGVCWLWLKQRKKAPLLLH